MFEAAASSASPESRACAGSAGVILAPFPLHAFAALGIRAERAEHGQVLGGSRLRRFRSHQRPGAWSPRSPRRRGMSQADASFLSLPALATVASRYHTALIENERWSRSSILA